MEYVGKGNVEQMDYSGNKLTIVFMNGRSYQYHPVSESQYKKLLSCAQKPTSDDFKSEFKKIKDNPEIKYQEI